MSKSLRQFLHEDGPGSMSRLAREANVSTSYICDMVKGRKDNPHRDIALRIEKATKGKVKAAVLMGLAEPKVSDDEYFSEADAA